MFSAVSISCTSPAPYIHSKQVSQHRMDSSSVQAIHTDTSYAPHHIPPFSFGQHGTARTGHMTAITISFPFIFPYWNVYQIARQSRAPTPCFILDLVINTYSGLDIWCDKAVLYPHMQRIYRIGLQSFLI